MSDRQRILWFDANEPAEHDHELIVDNFAGGGGASVGIEQALGRPVDIAVNHDAHAVAMHKANHPNTRHYCESVYDVDPVEATGGRPVGLAWFSPDCTDHSNAKNGKPKRKHIRGLAWIVLRWAAKVRPRIIVVENVVEFAQWGPLTRKRGREKHPQACRFRRTRTFRRWCRQAKSLGYHLECRELRAFEYGTPTIRKRLFIIMRCDGKPIVWPKPTHARPDIAAEKGLLPWRTAAECINWSLPCPSIFLSRKEGREIGVNRPLKPKTLARIANGVKRYVLDAKEPFIVEANHGDWWFRGQRVVEPLNTITEKHGHGLVVPYTVPRYGEAPGQEPRCGSVETPLPTITTTDNGASLVAPVLTYAQQGGACRSAESPLHTITASRKDCNSLIAASISSYYGPKSGDGGSRGSALGEPLRTATAENRFALVAAFLTRYFGQSIATSVEQPLGTICAENKDAVTAAFVAKHYGGMTGVEVDTPLPTTTARGTQNQLVAVNVSHSYTSATAGGQGNPDVPLKTILSANHANLVASFLAPYYGSGSGETGRDLREPAPTSTVKDRLQLVMLEIDGEPFVITDIGMRIFTPRELFDCQGFPSHYVIDVGINGKPAPKYVQVAACGNSVCPPVARAIVEANYRETPA